MKDSKEFFEVIIVGAGFAGLSAALRLKKDFDNILVLEARERVGGRTLNKDAKDGTLIELGGQWFGPTHTKVSKLVEKYKLEKYVTPPKRVGNHMIEFKKTINSDWPKKVNSLFSKIDNMAKELDLSAPWKHKKAKKWDSISIKDWLNKKASSREVANLTGKVVSETLLSCDPGELSLLEGLFYIASGEGLSIISAFEGGAQNYRLIKGLNHIAECMAKELGEGYIKFSSPVEKIEYSQHDSNTAVYTRDGKCYLAKAVIVTVPPVVNKKIKFTPALPAKKMAMFDSMIAGEAVKVHIVYSKPFWQERGLSGYLICENEILTEIVDNSHPKSKSGVLTCFIYGNQTKKIFRKEKDSKKRKKAVLKTLAKYFGDEALDPREFIEFDWLQEEWTNGCFSSHFKIGTFAKYGPQLRENVASIYWAGTENAKMWNGYVEGAIRSGEEIAEKVINEKLK